VGGNPGSLARAERALGLDSWSVSFEEVHPGYEIDEVLWPAGAGRVSRELARWQLFRRARDFDVVHFNFGSPILPRALPAGFSRSRFDRLFRLYAHAVEFRDVRWLRRAGKAVVVTYQGDDARQADWSRAHFETSPASARTPTSRDAALDAKRREWIEQFDRSADRIYALNPDVLHVLPSRAEFLPYAHIDLDEWKPVPADEARSLRIVHAPSSPEIKGTRWVVDAVERLRAEGVGVELDLVQGVPFDVARAAYERSDLAVDQLLVGWYGGLAVELMALGKPVVCYIRDEDLRFVPSRMRDELPLIRATGETLVDVLREWATDRRPELAAAGRRGRAYVERWHDRRAIAERLTRDYQVIVRSRGSR
jgi:glycosyltransferase involved in cell wall biosynthesis